MADVLLDKRSDGVALITLNRPESLNAFGEDLPRLFSESLEACRSDSAVRCVAITGAGRAFCAGGDIRGMKGMVSGGEITKLVPADDDIEGSIAMFKAFQDSVILALHAFPKPTVALVNGAAAGGGMGLALACDLRVLSDRAKLVTAFRTIGLSEDCGVAYFLERMVGRAITLELLYLGATIEAERALALRLANRVVPHDALMAEGLALAAEIASGPTAAFGRMKSNVTFAESASLAEVLDREALNWKLSQRGTDHREAITSFLERRKPVFRGL